ncbi:MAG TPA: adenylate/guanylate cyclase domain-containing protein [Candidatus Limnocylindria bacterium]|jgi:adenylate cyclase|nr:adenylate/guanylate cyclase domain-containing protein [Candidatus Limnocylindria bacterium]
MSPDGKQSPRRARSSIVVRLLAAFVVVSLLPIAVLAILSLQEAETDPAAHAGEAGEAAGHGSLAGIPIEFVELSVAGVSLALSVAAGFYVSRTIIRPLRSLEGSMQVLETGDLDVKAAVSTDDEIAHLAAAFNRMVAGLKREALVRDLFGQYVNPEVARLAIEQEGRLEGEVVECTVLFVDIRRFTSLAEVLPPKRLIGVLNRYFDRMLTVVEAEGGIVNKFGGDSLLAVFGSPLNPTADHAERAVRAALRMRIALAVFNREQVATEMPELRVGFGLATGELVAGNIGSSRKLEYTVIGDPVNLAARLQELTPELGADILMNATTARRASEVARFRSLGRIEIRGRAEPVEVFSAEDALSADATAVGIDDAADRATHPS